MQPIHSATILVRTRAGQAVVLGNEGLSPAQSHLLMRLNGYTPLAELVCETEEAEMLEAAEQLVAAGLAQSSEPDGAHAPMTSQWGDLLSADAAGG